METTQKNAAPSGYQSRPARPTSAGRALSVLVAVCAVLWVWLILPEWWLSGTGNQPSQRALADIVFYTLLASPLWSNYVVFRWATRPLWCAEATQVEFLRSMVLLLCLTFHLIHLLFGGFLVVCLSLVVLQQPIF